MVHPRPAPRLAPAKVMADAANADPGDHGHAPNEDRQYYYYKVSFVDDTCRPTPVVPGRRFGEPLGHADKFPGWDVALRHWEELLAKNSVKHPIPGVWYLL